MINIAGNLAKALLPTLPPGAQERAINPSEIVLATGVRNIIDTVSGTSWMSPNQPMAPIAPSGTLPRVFDYPFGANLFFQPRQEQPGSPDFDQLRMLAKYDIVRLCIETRKVQILEMPWAFRTKRQPGEKKKQYEARNHDDERIAMLNEFFLNPDREHTFRQWMNMIVEEVLVTDALSIWPVLNQDQELMALRCIDGGVIKPLHDPQGWRPNPPNPAYQEIIKGSPAINMTAGLCDDCQKRGWHADPKNQPEGRGMCLPLIYHPFNVTVNKFYGWSPTEQVMHTILLGMNRMVSQMSLYTEGNLPEAVCGVPNEWGIEQIKQFQAFFDELAGNVSIKRRIRFLPGEAKFVQTKDPMIKDDRDDWLARVCCYAFSVAPNALIKQLNRASSQQLQESSVAEGKLPLLGQLSELMSYIVHHYFGPDFADIEHAYDTDSEADPSAQAKIDDLQIRNGSKSINEARDDAGSNAIPGGDVHRIYLPTGPITLDDADTASANMAEPTPTPQPPPQFGGMPNLEQGHPLNPRKSKVPAQLRQKGKDNGNPELTPAAEKEAKKLAKMLPFHSTLIGGNGNGRNRFVY